MTAELMAGYVVYVDGKATTAGRSMDEAKQLSKVHMADRKALRIESAVAPAPSQVWNYDYNISVWVERR